MATKTREKPKTAAKKKRMKIAVEYGSVGSGENTCRVGIKIDRADMDAATADEVLCGRRIYGSARVSRTTDEKDQEALPGMQDASIAYEMSGMFDIKRVGLSPKEITAGLTFGLKDTDVETLSHFAKRKGWIHVEQIEDLADEDDDSED